MAHGPPRNRSIHPPTIRLSGFLRLAPRLSTRGRFEHGASMPPDNAGSPSDKGENGAATDTAAMQKMIDDAIGKALAARLPRVKNMEEIVATKIAEAFAKLTPAEKPAEPANGNVADGDQKLTLKTLQEQLAKLNQGIQERDRKIVESEQRMRDVRLRSEVSQHFAKHLGADSPHLTPYVNHFLGQFVDQEGQPMRKMRNEYQEDQFIPAGQAVEDLFKGELKHLVQQSKAQQLPPNQWGRANGQPVQPQNQNGQQQQGRVNPLLATIAQGISDERPEAAQIVMNDATRINAPSNGNSRK